MDSETKWIKGIPVIPHEDFQRWWNLMYGGIPPHDDLACNALGEYIKECDSVEARLSPQQLMYGVPGAFAIMKRIADQHNVTIEDMKMHWRCHKDQE